MMMNQGQSEWCHQGSQIVLQAWLVLDVELRSSRVEGAVQHVVRLQLGGLLGIGNILFDLFNNYLKISYLFTSRFNS